MNIAQIYTTLNDLGKQVLGLENLSVVNTTTFMDYGRKVLSSDATAESFLNTLVLRIYRTVMVNRSYSTQLRGIIKTSEQYGAITQKIDVDMPEYEEDASVNLVDGASVDQWVVNKPKTRQWLFQRTSTASLHITIQRRWLKQAFLSEDAMAAFIAMVFTKIHNRMEIGMESMAQTCLNNRIAVDINAGKQVQLVTMYNNEKPDANIPIGIEAMHYPDFMRWATGIINQAMKALTKMSTLYNPLGLPRFTPFDRMKLYTLSRFDTQLDTVALYGAINPQYIKLIDHTSLAYWQGTGTGILDFDARSAIDIEFQAPDMEAPKTLQAANIVAALFDTDALGAFRAAEEVHTTPLNARGLYYNTFWFDSKDWFNALDENFMVFTLT